MSEPKAIGLHIYSGTFTFGIREAGFEIAGQWEEGPWGAATFDLNFPGVPHPLERADWPVAEARGNTTLMYANPPCAPWSMAGAKLGMADPRVVYTDHCVDTALQVKPDFFVWESVCRAFTLGRPKVDEITEKFHRQGYAVTILFTNAVLHGVPQSRERFHFIAHRFRLPFQTPQVDYKDVMTVRQAIGDLEKSAVPVGVGTETPTHVYEPYDERGRNVLERLSQGEGWDKAYARAVADGVPAKKARFLCWRLWYDAPCGTIADVNALVHPTADRCLTIREAARLCGLPDSFEFADHGEKKYRYTGGVCKEDVTQAVMAPVGRFLGQTFLKALDAGERAEAGSLEMIDWRKLARPYSPRRFAKEKLS